MSLIEAQNQPLRAPEAEARPEDDRPKFLILSILRRVLSSLLKKPIFLMAALVSGLPGSLIKAGLDPFMGSMLGGLADHFFLLLVYAGLALAAAQSVKGETITLGPSLQRGLSRSLSVFLLAVLIPICVAACFVAFIVPGLILICLWSVAVPACVLEDLGPIGGINRSEALTRGFRLKIFVLLVISILAEILLSIYLVWPLMKWAWSLVSGSWALLSYLVAPVLFAPLLAFNYLVMTAIYTDLKAIEDSRADNRIFLEIFD